MRRIMREHVARFLGQVGRGLWLFSGARLRGADLRRACLDGVTLAQADLRWARLQGASLRGARLDGASLRGADLRDADMRGADLRDADMRGARLDGINVRGAWVDDDTLALLDEAPDARYTGVIVSVHRASEGEGIGEGIEPEDGEGIEQGIEQSERPARCRACGWRGFASASDCPNCGAVALMAASHASAQAGEDERQREGERRQRANFNATADGMAPPYPSEY